MNAIDAHAVASRFVVNYVHLSASMVIADLARLLGAETVCAIAMEQQQTVMLDNERIQRFFTNQEKYETSAVA